MIVYLLLSPISHYECPNRLAFNEMETTLCPSLYILLISISFVVRHHVTAKWPKSVFSSATQRLVLSPLLFKDRELAQRLVSASHLLYEQYQIAATALQTA